MNTRQFHYLITINNLKTLSSASKALNISQPALSKFLSKCEDTFGFPLFIRHNKELSPTAIGRYVILCAHKILDEKNRMLLTMNEVSGNNRNKIRLATAPNRGAIIYSKIYNEFSRRFPDTALELVELFAREQPGAIASGYVDLALGSGETSTSVKDIPIAHEELVVSIPISHPLAQNHHIQLSELRDTPFVLQSRKHSIRILADRLFEKAGFDPLIIFESDDVLLIDSMLRQAVGVGLVSQSHISPCDNVAYIPLNPPVYQQLHIRYVLNHSLSPSEKFLASLLVRERLGDSRYEAIHNNEVDELLLTVEDATEGENPDYTAEGSFIQNARYDEVQCDIKILEYLVAIIDEKSLSAAADKLYLAQPALSRHLKNMEQSIGLRLFTREFNQLQTTNAGKIFANHARNIIHIENEMLSYISLYKTGHSGKYYVYSDSLLSEYLRVNLTDNFKKIYPEIELIVQDSSRETIIESLLNASIDIGLYFTCNPTHDLLNNLVIMESELVYCSSKLDSTPSENDSSNNNKFMLAPKNTSLRQDQEKLIADYFPDNYEVVCEATLPILRKLLGATDANTILPLHFSDSINGNKLHSFNPPQKYYLVIGTRVGRKLPKVTEDIVKLIKKLSSKIYN
ncbi:LysR substrate-binding domain-containing protein [Proteiniclasticum sp. C24MP]|uniref:LysR substrate-binding domain-containing protein n=1 Tax=Proteiniclasticum sp. C24MP TaxID=3374101 RepID=UPI00375417E4